MTNAIVQSFIHLFPFVVWTEMITYKRTHKAHCWIVTYSHDAQKERGREIQSQWNPNSAAETTKTFPNGWVRRETEVCMMNAFNEISCAHTQHTHATVWVRTGRSSKFKNKFSSARATGIASTKYLRQLCCCCLLLLESILGRRQSQPRTQPHICRLLHTHTHTGV